MATLVDICKAAGPTISGPLEHNGRPVVFSQMLWAIAGNESTFGKRSEFVKHEPAYLPGGTYYQRSKDLQQAYYRFGVLAGSSFGPFQIMYPTACELGFLGDPIELQSAEKSVIYVAKLISERFIKRQGAKTLSDVLDAYNSGSSRDAIVPQAYIDRGIHYYELGFPS